MRILGTHDDFLNKSYFSVLFFLTEILSAFIYFFRSSNDGFLLPPRRTIGHPSAISEAGFPAVVGRRNHYTALGSSSSAASSVTNPHYKRFHDYASFSSFSDTSSHIGIVRRPSVDTISTYLSSQYR